MSLRSCRHLASSFTAVKNGMISNSNRLGAARGRYNMYAALQRSLSTPSDKGTDGKTSDKPAVAIPVAFVADGPNDFGYLPDENDPRFVHGKPTLDYARCMPQSFSAMRHEQILQLAADGVKEARTEALVRNIMAVDEIEYDDAVKVMEKVRKSNRRFIGLHHFPHGVGLVTAVTAGFSSIPLVFYSPAVHKFNELFVTADIPEPKDLETWLEVGSWSWAWMEPVLGQVSFFLLTAQFARAQIRNMGIKPYTNFMRERRARQLMAMYPQYHPEILANFSRSDAFVRD